MIIVNKGVAQEVSQEADRILRKSHKTYNGYVLKGDNVEFIGVSELESAAVLSEVESGIDFTLLSKHKESSVELVLQKIDAYPVLIFRASRELLTIYERKQNLVNSWQGPGIPHKVVIEWDNDWGIRPEYVLYGFCEVNAIGIKFQCKRAEDLWEIWKLNTIFANYLDSMSEPIRTKAQYGIHVSQSTDEVDDVVSNFTKDLYNLPTLFSQSIAPGVIAESGLTIVS